MKIFVIAVVALLLPSCTCVVPPTHAVPASDLDYSGRDDVLGGGAKMIPVQTPKGTCRVWTKRVGDNPTILHGGPGVTYEYLEAFDSDLPAAGVEYDYYD